MTMAVEQLRFDEDTPEEIRRLAGSLAMDGKLDHAEVLVQDWRNRGDDALEDLAAFRDSAHALLIQQSPGPDHGRLF
jgi:hypothetical protein